MSLSSLVVCSICLGERFRIIGGYRNRMVHGCDEVSGAELFDILTTQLADIRVAAEAFRVWLAAHPDRVDTRL